MNLSVHVQRVVLHDGVDVSREALEAAIADALRDRLGSGTHAAPPHEPSPHAAPLHEPSPAVEVARAVAPAVIGMAGGRAVPGSPDRGGPR